MAEVPREEAHAALRGLAIPHHHVEPRPIRLRPFFISADRLPFAIFPTVTPFLLRETAATGYKSRVLCFPREPDYRSGDCHLQ